MVEKEQVRPLAPAAAVDNSSGGVDEEGASGWRSAQYLRKRRGILCCCGCCGLTVVIVGLIILILALTVFKVKNPTLTMNSIHIDSVNVDVATIDHPVSVNATLTADISIKNPNVASFRFHNSTTEFYYKGETVGVAYAPDGKVSADRTVRMNVTVDVLTDRVAMQPNMTNNIIEGGSVNLTSYTEITGRVNVLGVFKRNLDIMLNCSMTLDLSLSQPDIKNKECQADTK